ncbi:MAG: hypothetical protein IKR19_08905 [Acholeplasmatales bacterium]|nr:hypothetical protein [Acholeplasmatales bacterium]
MLLYKVMGEPISMVRYRLNWQTNKITALDYRTSKKDFKITSSMDKDNIIVNLQGNYNGAVCNFPINGATFFNLDEYKNIFKNRAENTRSIPPLHIIKNTSGNEKPIDIPFGDYELQIQLKPGCDAIFYLDHVSIFDSNKVEIAKYYIYDDGIYEIAKTLSNFTYLSKEDGRSSGMFSLDNFISSDKVMPSLSKIIPLAKLPTRLIDESGANIKISYDQYDMMTDISDNTDIQVFYTPEYEKDIYKIRESVHHLIYDNFDYSNHYYNTRKAVAESIKINDSFNEVEYVGITFDNVEAIIEVGQYQYRQQDDFYLTEEKYFKY